MANVNADINEQLSYASEFLQSGGGSQFWSLQLEDSFSSFFDNLSSIDTWSSPTYDDSKPSYNLVFSSKKTADFPAGKFSINHAVSGQDDVSNNIGEWGC
mgnify:CR=1 FL=1